MAGRRAEAPIAKRQLAQTQIADPTVNRVLDGMRSAIVDVQSTSSVFDTTADLVVGVNAVKHSLGRAVKAVVLTPTVADATFAWAIVTNNPHPDRQVLINVIGVGQPGALLRFM